MKGSPCLDPTDNVRSQHHSCTSLPLDAARVANATSGCHHLIGLIYISSAYFWTPTLPRLKHPSARRVLRACIWIHRDHRAVTVGHLGHPFAVSLFPVLGFHPPSYAIPPMLHAAHMTPKLTHQSLGLRLLGNSLPRLTLVIYNGFSAYYVPYKLFGSCDIGTSGNPPMPTRVGYRAPITLACTNDDV